MRFLSNRYTFLIGAFLIVFSTRAQNFTEVVAPTFEGLEGSKAAWVDFNNDGLLDLFIHGTTNGGANKVTIRYNNGDETFNTLSLVSWGDVAYDFGDYNNDGFIDILLAGKDNANQKQFLVFINNAGTSFTNTDLSLTGFDKGGVQWRDFDHDGDLDIVASGLNQSNATILLVYENNAGVYTPVSQSISGQGNGRVKAFDANNDGVDEVIITGFNPSLDVETNVYTISEELVLSSYAYGILGYALNGLALGDYNRDGFDDLVLTGFTDATSASADLFFNNQVNGFNQLTPFLQPLSSSDVAFGDLNNDGLQDIMALGSQGSTEFLLYYKNSFDGSNYSFSTTANTLLPMYDGGMALGDYDNDGDQDIFQIGNTGLALEARLFASDQAATTANAPPSTPATPVAITDESNVSLSWSAGSDDLTSAASLTYNLYVSNEAAGADLLRSPLSNLSTGYRKVMAPGNASHATTYDLRNLPEGVYYWAVQSIDDQFKGSAFTTEQSFTICYHTSIGADTTICKNEMIEFEVSDAEAVSTNWYTLQDGLQLTANLNFSYTATKKDTIVAEITKTFGCTVYDTLIVDIYALPEFNLGNDTSICFGQSISFDASLLGITGLDSVNWYSTTSGSLAEDNEQLTYEVTVKDTLVAEVFNANGCLWMDSVIVDVLSLPDFNLGNDTILCYAANLDLSVSGLGIIGLDSVNWYSKTTGSLLKDSESLSYSVLGKDTLIAEVFNANGCVNYDTLVVDAFAFPVFSLGNDTSICFGETLPLSVASFVSTNVGEVSFDQVNWFSTRQGSLLSDSETLSFEVFEKDTLVVEVLTVKGCLSYDSLIVDVLALPVFDIGNDTSICFGSNILLETGALFDEVNWYSLDQDVQLVSNSWFFNYEVTATDTLVAEVFTPSRCVSYDTIIIAMDPLPVFSLGDDQAICTGDSVTLNVSGSFSSVEWFTTGNQLLQSNSATYKFKVLETITLWAEVTNAKGCIQYDTITVESLDLPVFDLGEDQTFCFGDSVTLDVPVAGSDFT